MPGFLRQGRLSRQVCATRSNRCCHGLWTVNRDTGTLPCPLIKRKLRTRWRKKSPRKKMAFIYTVCCTITFIWVVPVCSREILLPLQRTFFRIFFSMCLVSKISKDSWYLEVFFNIYVRQCTCVLINLYKMAWQNNLTYTVFSSWVSRGASIEYKANNHNTGLFINLRYGVIQK